MKIEKQVMIWEIIRIGFMFLVGAGLMFYGQPKLYESEIIPLINVDPADWASNQYLIGAGVVFGVSVLLAILWYLIGFFAQITGSWDVPGKKPLWYIFLFFSVVSVFVAVWLSCQYLSGASEEALYTLLPLFFVDMVWLFWLTTAISSPGSLKFIPVGAFLLRRLISGG